MIKHKLKNKELLLSLFNNNLILYLSDKRLKVERYNIE